MRDKPRELKVKILPFDKCDADVLLSDLHKSGFIVRYEVQGVKYIEVQGFVEHQRFHKDEKPLGIPAPPQPAPCQHPASTVPAPPGPDEKPASTVPAALVSEVLYLKSEKDSVDKPSVSSTGHRVFEHWVFVMGKNSGSKFNTKRQGAVSARMREGYSEEQLKLAVDGCALTPHNMGQNDRGERYDDLELICRNGPQVERFIQNAKSPPVPGNGIKTLRTDTTDAEFERGMAAYETDENGDLIIPRKHA